MSTLRPQVTLSAGGVLWHHQAGKEGGLSPEDIAAATVRARPGRQAPFAFSFVNRFCVAVLYGRAGR
jgi:hypothetical protein